MEWNGDKVTQDIADRVRRAVQLSAIELVNDVRTLISTPSRTVSFVKDKKGKMRKVLGARGSDRSRPGEPPHKDTGALRSSINHEMDAALPIARVGSAIKYARFLELGTTKMAPRPFLRRQLAANKAKIEARINAAVKLT